MTSSRPCQKAWWGCQHWWEVDNNACVISPQRPSYVHKSGWAHWLSCSRASWGCFHPLHENIWCIGTQGGGCPHWGSLCCRDDEGSWTSQESGVEKNPRNGLSNFCFSSVPLWLPWSPVPPLWNISKKLFLPWWGGIMTRMSLSIKVANGSTESHNSLMYASSWCSLLAQIGWVFLAQNCKVLVYARSS